METKLLISVSLFLAFAGRNIPINAMAAETPVLYFSDLTSGPKTGWNMLPGKGAAVSIWGKNLGSSRGSSYVSVGGVNLTSDSDYAEWGITGHENGIPRGLERITFWLTSVMPDGNVNISVNVDGQNSGNLPFVIRPGNIYFVSPSGDDNNSGIYENTVGEGNGPWRHIYKAMPSSSVFDPGDIVYVREGVYTDLHRYSSYLRFYDNDCGAAGFPVSYAAYPAEKAVMGDGTYDGIREHDYACEYVTISKFFINANVTAVGMASGDVNKSNWRVVGNDITTAGSGWTGTLIFGASPVDEENFKIFGNHIHDLAGDKYYHAMYIGTVYNFPDLHNKGVEIAWNELHDFVDTGTDGNAGGPSGIYIHPTDTNAGEADEIYIHDNLVYNLPHAGLALASSVKNAYLWNNILYNCGNNTFSARPSVHFGIHNDVTSNVRFYNNTIYDNNVTGTDSLVLFVDAVGIQNNVEMKNNIFYSLTSGFDQSPSGNVNSDHDLWYGSPAPTYAANYLAQDPLFVNVSNADFRLRSNSPAVNAGSSSLSGIVTRDFIGISRPQGQNYDIGAFEFTESDATPPAIPSGLEVK
ncbi:MAG: hypothetical protein A2219_06930 [Elusimicrobia bacterium RIFOXYA2_FULL_50_26]|nr:MAG: hypothetical protein A2219_06930 [Elusimicrobia bacterium RIFOXYA2_FULL_50_26]OGS23452.1 MAG: hypothetical protein A2314_00305 [Elusimicrobia bacterium RIFOXYB2_FULL_50_12]